MLALFCTRHGRKTLVLFFGVRGTPNGSQEIESNLRFRFNLGTCSICALRVSIPSSISSMLERLISSLPDISHCPVLTSFPPFITWDRSGSSSSHSSLSSQPPAIAIGGRLKLFSLSLIL